MAAVAGRADPRRPVHPDSDVALTAELRLAGVQAHPDPALSAVGPGVRRKVALRADRGGKRVLRRPEGDEEGVALRVDFAPLMGGERGPQNPLMLGKQLAVPAAAQLFEQPRRPFDVCEQEGDGAAVQLRRGAGHPAREGRASVESCQGCRDRSLDGRSAGPRFHERLGSALLLQELVEVVEDLGAAGPEASQPRLDDLRPLVELFPALERVGLDSPRHLLRSLPHRACLTLGLLDELGHLGVGLAAALCREVLARASYVAGVRLCGRAQLSGFLRNLLDLHCGRVLGRLLDLGGLLPSVRTDLLRELLGGFDHPGDPVSEVGVAPVRGVGHRRLRLHTLVKLVRHGSPPRC